MTLDILPDPARPLGGGALLRLADGERLGTQTTLAIYDRSRERWLADQTWQPVPVRFGPYAVRQGADGSAEITVGSEIVDHIEEYTPLTLQLGNHEVDADWPDTIMYAPGSPPLANIVGPDLEEAASLAGTVPAAPDPAESSYVQQPDPEPAADPAPPSGAVAPDASDTDTTAKVGPNWAVWGAAAAVLLAAFLVYMFWPEDAPTETASGPAHPASPAAECDRAALAGLGLSFSDLHDRLSGCAGSIETDQVIGLLEGAVRAGEADALLAFGKLYDGAATDPVLEDQLGLGYPEKLHIAARYYFEARNAGATDAENLLASVCQRVAETYDELVIETAAEFCE